MEVNLDDIIVTNNEEAQRFEATVDGVRAILTYRRFPDRIVFDHTGVPPQIEAKGVAAKLTGVALDFARANHLRVVPLCPYVSSFIQKHREYQDLVSTEDLQKLLSR